MSEIPLEEEKVSPEGIEELDQAYPEEEIEIYPSEEPEAPRPRRRREEPREEPWEEDRRRRPDDARFFQNMMSGDIGLGEALLVMEYWDRKDRREDKPTTTEDITKAVEATLDKRGITSRPSDEPEWAKSMKNDMAGISKKLEDDERKKEQEELIERATQPLKTELEKEREERKRIEKDIEDLKKPSTPADAKTGMDQYLDYRRSLTEAGLLKEDTGKVVFGPDGIPVSGDIPAWVIYAPTLADEIFDNIEKRIEKIATGFGVDRKSKGLEDLIVLPDRPEPEKSKPPLRPVEREEAPMVEEEAVAPLKPEEPEEPAEELIKLPERVKPEAEAPTVEEEAVAPLNQGLVTSEIEYEPESEVFPEEAEAGTYPEEPEPESPEPDKKQYFCRFCGEGPFDESWQIAQHVKGCETAKAAKEATE